MTKRKIGRPRCEKSRDAILDAALGLLREQGSGALTIEAIARRAEVGKPTIYRWWPTLADIVLEALLRQADADIPVEPYESLRTTLRKFLRQSARAINAGAGEHLRFLMAQAQRDDEFRERFRDQFVSRRRHLLISILQQAVAHGDIAPENNLELLADLVFGAKWYRLLTGHNVLDQAFADELTETVVRLAHPSSS